MENRSPVVLVPYSSTWPAQFDSIKQQLAAIFPLPANAIEHIGSTAVPGLTAKPVIDIMLGAPTLAAIEAKLEALAALDFRYVPGYNSVMPMRRYFVRPSTRPRDVHLHAVALGETFWCDHLLFRDALRGDADLAREYAMLKRKLAERFANDSTAYTDAKTAFVRRALNHARMTAK